MKQSHWLLCVAKNYDWSQKNHATVTLESSVRFSRNEIENLQRKQNRTVKSTNLKENAGKVKSVFL